MTRSLAPLTLAALLLASPSPAETSTPRRDAARELSWSGEYRDSLALYLELVTEQPRDALLRREYGMVLLWASRELDAIPELEHALYADPSDDEVRLALARAHNYLGRNRKAASYYEFVLPTYATDPKVVAEAVPVLFAAGREDAAARWLSHGLDLQPRDPELRVLRASAWIESGDLDRGEAELKSILASVPGHENAREKLDALRREQEDPLARARSLGDSGDYRKARGLLEGWLGEHPDDPEALLLLARYSAWSAHYTRAQALYGRLLEADPTDRALRTELADVTSWRGQYAQALSLYQILADEDPADPKPRLGMANVHLWSGVQRRADRELRGILSDHPEYEGARAQLEHLRRLQTPALRPELSWFEDSEGFSLWTQTTKLAFTPRPGRTITLSLDTTRASGERLTGFDPVTGTAIRSRKTSDGVGLRLAFRERPDRAWEAGAELGAARYDGGGLSPRLRLYATWFPSDRHSVQLDLRHEDAFPAVRSIESVLEGVDRTTLFAVHNYAGERFSSWTRVEAGHYSDGPDFWAVRTVVGFSLVKRPLTLDLLALATVGDFDAVSPLYYSPQELLSYALGLRLKKKLWSRFDFVLLAELGKVHSDGTRGDTLRFAPELVWSVTPNTSVSLRYDHYESVRSGFDYSSDFVALWIRHRFTGLAAPAS